MTHRISKGLLRTISLIMCFLTLSWGLMPVAQAVDVGAAPIVASSEVTDKGDISITFNKAMADPAGKEAQFCVEVNDGEVDVTDLQTTSTPEKIKLVLANKVVGGQSVTVAYNMGMDEASQIAAVDGGILETFPAQTVTNNLPNAPPVLSADAINNIVGQAVEITFTDNSAWKTAITEIDADGVALGNTKYTINNASINIAADVFTSAKDYTIIVKATGYADANINQAITAAQTNDLPKTPPALSADITNNIVGQAVEITFNDDSAWRTAITEIDADGVALGNTKYTINNASINIAADVFTSAKDYNIVVKATGYADASISQAITAAQTNDLLKTPPALNADITNNIVGQAVEITFNDDSAWRTAITEIDADGVALGNTKYTINNASINIAADVFTSAKDYNIVVKATGYADASISQAITAAQTSSPPAWASDAGIAVSNVTGSSFSLNWTAATDAQSYKVVVSNTTGGSTTPVLDTTVATGTSLDVTTALTANRHYDIKVTASNSAGDSPTSLTSLVVTTPDKPSFSPALASGIPNGSVSRYVFQPAATIVDTTSFEQIYAYDNVVDPANTRFLWYLQAGFNNTNARVHVDSYRLFNLTDGEEIALNYGDTNFGTSTSGWTASGITESDTGYKLTSLMTSGDFKVAKLTPPGYSVCVRFELDIAKYLEPDKEYAITIDPQFNTGGNSPTVLGKVYRFEFSTFMADTQAPVWETGDQISMGEITVNSIALSWPPASDISGVAKYKVAVSKDGNPLSQQHRFKLAAS